MANKLYLKKGLALEVCSLEGNIAVTLHPGEIGRGSYLGRNFAVEGKGLALGPMNQIQYENLPLGTQAGEL